MLLITLQATTIGTPSNTKRIRTKANHRLVEMINANSLSNMKGNEIVNANEKTLGNTIRISREVKEEKGFRFIAVSSQS